MTRWPRSIAGRMLALATLSTLVALAFAGITIGRVLDRWVVRGLDQQLDAEVAMLVRAVRPDGSLDRARVIDLPSFAADAPGWGWRVEGAGGGTGGDAALPTPAPTGGPASPPAESTPLRGRHDANHPWDGVARSGEAVHGRWRRLPRPGNGGIIVSANAPLRIARAPLRQAMVPLLGSMLLLGLALLLANLAQLWLGLKPLRELHRALGAVRAGRMDQVPTAQPIELLPLATELNALLRDNAAGLERARGHAANLAHGLKTPLAALLLKLAEEGRDPDGELAAMVAGIDGRVRHHLSRARMAAGFGGRARMDVAATVEALVAVLARLHADREVVCRIALPPGLAVAVDAEDLDEMLGNLLDNAWRHARATVSLHGRAADRLAVLEIADDGPGLSPDQWPDALRPGRRLDEAGDGHGFGLWIVRELAELYGGDFTIARSGELGGLCATLSLPVAR